MTSCFFPHSPLQNVVILGVVLLGGCAPHVRSPEAMPGQGNSNIVSVGPVGFRLTAANTAPTAQVYGVNDHLLSGGGFGYPGSVTTKAGEAKLRIICMLNAQALTGVQRPFDELEDGVGHVTGPIGGVQAQILLTADLRPEKTYDLRCEPVGNYRARAWLTERK